MSRGEILSMLASALMLWWVRVVTGQGALAIIMDNLPSLGING